LPETTIQTADTTVMDISTFNGEESDISTNFPQEKNTGGQG
jgi:hypothetical protein